MRLTPSPRILSVLGEIEFENWQCIAEFIDNSIDAMRKEESASDYSALEATDKALRIDVTIPTGRAGASDYVEVFDSGPGMSRENLENALRAGWTSNDPANNLGLFGMGFNVASARLGSVTEVWTSRSEDNFWTKVTIDLAKVGEDFDVPDESVPKQDPQEHGTRIRISKLHKERASSLRLKSALLSDRLGRLYSWILLRSPFDIRINGEPLVPYRFCVWDSSRSVRFGRTDEEISAIQTVDHPLSDAQFCQGCGNWEALATEECSNCGSTKLTPKERRITGWVGIQRYLDSSEYGIDFLRNGRRILISDKSLFNFETDNGELEIEYPVEQPANRGRIVGEIHLDHVPVDYRKDRFDTNSREWRYAREVLRGRGPLKPERAKQLNYESNESPIGLLFRGYRRNDPGRRSLIPGDGVAAVHEKAKGWGQKFHSGDSDYHSDAVWWEAVESHEARRAELAKPEEGIGGLADANAVVEALGGTGSPPKPAGDSAQRSAAAKRTTNEIIKELIESSTEVSALSRDIFVQIINESIEVEVREMNGRKLVDHLRDDQEVPVLVHVQSGRKYLVFVDRSSPIFNRFAVNPLHAVAVELAQALLIKSNSQGKFSTTRVAEEIEVANFDEFAITLPRVREKAGNLLDEIRDSLVSNASEFADALVAQVTESEHDEIIQSMGKAPARSDTPKAVLILSRFPASQLAQAISEIPEAFFGGRVFRDGLSLLKTDSARLEYTERVSRLVEAAASVSTDSSQTSHVNELSIIQLQLDLLENELER